MSQAEQLSLFPGVPPTPVLDIVPPAPKPKPKKKQSRGNVAYLPDGRLGYVLMENGNDDCLLSVQGQPMVFAAKDLSFCGFTISVGDIEFQRQQVYLENTALTLAIHSAETNNSFGVDVKELREQYVLRQKLLREIDAEIRAREERKQLPLQKSSGANSTRIS